MEASKPNSISAPYKAASRTDKLSLETLCKYWRSSQVDDAIDSNNYTLLHFIAFYGNAVAIKRLRDEKLLTTKQLNEMRDVHGDTALHVAARFGRLDVVKEILNGEQNTSSLILAVNKTKDTPIYVAAASGKIEVFDFLRDKVERKDVTKTERDDGRTVLHVAVEGEFFELACIILREYPELGDRPNKEGFTPLYLLASKKTSFRSGTMYKLTNLCASPFIPWRIITIFFYFLCLPPSSAGSKTFVSTILAGYRRVLQAIPFFKEACNAREKHVYAYALACDLVKGQQQWPRHEPFEDSSSDLLIKEERKNIPDTPIEEVRKSIPDPLIKAVRNGIMELVKIILYKFPEAATAVDKNKKNILLVAAEMKNVFMYEYLKRKVEDKQKLLSEVDCHGNTALHLAASNWELSKNTYSPLMGMAWSVFWYQHVKQDMQLPVIRYKNSDRLTAKEVYKKNYLREPKSKETMLIKEAEEDAKKVNEGLMLVSVLISTINFAAIFTVPGGFSQDFGIPFFFQQRNIKNKELDYFLLYIGVSLLSSLIALGTQLSIHLSRFRKIDFYFILPSKMLIATTALYYATTFSITACFQAYILEEALEEKVFVGMLVACIPAALVYFDLVYYIMNYLYFPVWYKFLAAPRQVLLHMIKSWK